VRLSALTESSILRTASLEFDIGILLGVFLICGVAPPQAAGAFAHSIVFPVVANAGPRPPPHCLRLLAGSLWHLVCHKRACQGAAWVGSTENTRTLTFWHLACQK
jgi:hypothetical protein